MNSKDVAEKELLSGVRAGDEALFEELVARYTALVLSTALRLTGSKAEAEDVAQEVFWRVHRKIGTYDPSRPFVPWLYKVTLNVAYTHLRRRARRTESSIEEIQPQFDREGMQVPDQLVTVPDLEDRMATREMAERAEQIIAELPEEYGTVVWMHDVASISAATLTEVLGLSLPAIKSRLHRGRLGVRKRLLESLTTQELRASERMPPRPMGGRMGITCREVVEDLLRDYFEGRLNADDRERFEQHIRGCDRCGPFVESYRQIVQGLSKMPEPPIPPEMVETTLAFVRESLESGRYLGRNWAGGLSAAFGRGLRRLFRRTP